MCLSHIKSTFRHEKAVRALGAVFVRMNISNALLAQFRRNKSEFWRRLITIDETWIHHYMPETFFVKWRSNHLRELFWWLPNDSFKVNRELIHQMWCSKSRKAFCNFYIVNEKIMSKLFGERGSSVYSETENFDMSSIK